MARAIVVAFLSGTAIVTIYLDKSQISVTAYVLPRLDVTCGPIVSTNTISKAFWEVGVGICDISG